MPSGFFSSPGPLDAVNAMLTFLPGPYIDRPEAAKLVELANYGEIPVTMKVSGGGPFAYLVDDGPGGPNYWDTGPEVSMRFDFFYRGLTPLSFQGVDYADGATLLTAQIYFFNVLGGRFAGARYSSDLGVVTTFIAPSQGGAVTLSDAPVFHSAHYWPSIDNYATRVSGYFVGGVPEPATWALMLLGFGLVGGSLRERIRRDRRDALELRP